jgi:hypothetical protein
MTALKKFDLSVIEAISKILGDTSEGFTGSEIGKLLKECRILDPYPGITKWRRLFEALKQKQEQDDCSNNVCDFIQNAMNPARHFNKQEWFSSTQYKLNKVLSFEGLSLGEDGKLGRIKKASTLSEAAARASKLRDNLLNRNVHTDVLKFCKEELHFHSNITSHI